VVIIYLLRLRKGGTKMQIQIFHNHYEEEKLNKVIEEMKLLGAPEIKAVYDDLNGIYLAAEGCHRIRAAKELNLIPEIVEISIEEALEINIKESGDERSLEMFEEFFWLKNTEIFKF
jgi:hypothetical protein